MSYVGLEFAGDQTQQHLGGNIKSGDPFTYCPTVWNYLIERFCISSVLDLGSGSGNSAEYFFRKGMKTLAVDGFAPNVLSSLYPAILHDLTSGPVNTKVDLVHCQEVVEHIEEKFLENLLRSLICGKVIVMTHALPGQAGYHHVNLQPSEYWVNHLARHGCVLLEEDTRRMRAFAKADGARYVEQTGMVFLNRARI